MTYHDPNMPPVLPYGTDEDANSGFAAGVATSEERARRDDADGTTSARQRAVLRLLGNCRSYGATWHQVANGLLLHHGQASGVLSGLHKAGLIERLTERRDRCFVYVLPEYVGDRETQPQGRPFKPCNDPACAQVETMMVSAESAIRRVRALHRPSTDHPSGYDPYCVGCWEAGGYDGAPSYPCDTIRALDGATMEPTEGTTR